MHPSTCCGLFHKLLPTMTFPQLGSWQWKRGVRSTMIMAKGCQGKNSDWNDVTSQESLTVTKSEFGQSQSDSTQTVIIWKRQLRFMYGIEHPIVGLMECFLKFESLLGVCGSYLYLPLNLVVRSCHLLIRVIRSVVRRSLVCKLPRYEWRSMVSFLIVLDTKVATAVCRWTQ